MAFTAPILKSIISFFSVQNYEYLTTTIFNRLTFPEVDYGNISNYTETYNSGIRLLAKEQPSATLTIETLILRMV